MRNIRGKKKEGIVFKVDFRKAYGMVDWDFFGFFNTGKGLE